MKSHLTNWYAKDVGEQLKKEVVACHASIHIHLLQLSLGRVLVHALQDLVWVEGVWVEGVCVFV